jgi:hypothetical protein
MRCAAAAQTVRFGSKCEILIPSGSRPPRPRQQTSGEGAAMTVSCQQRKCAAVVTMLFPFQIAGLIEISPAKTVRDVLLGELEILSVKP